ncbi:MAG: hypothetical protein KC646_00660 [Candidatus Cloacimonetes bacterium]|nr:hypothetical protein [Candidatus Cloacimonadota bacterium]
MKNLLFLCMVMWSVYGGKLQANIVSFSMHDIPLKVLFVNKNVYFSAKLFEILLNQGQYKELLHLIKHNKSYAELVKNELFIHRSLSHRYFSNRLSLSFKKRKIYIKNFSLKGFSGIAVKATSFEPQVIASKGSRGDFKMNRWDMGVALPSRKYLGKTVLIYYPPTNKYITTIVNDVGPWNIDDPWLHTAQRPQSESGKDNRGRKTNRAGIDLSYPAWVELGVSYDKSYSGNFSDYVKFILLD